MTPGIIKLNRSFEEFGATGPLLHAVPAQADATHGRFDHELFRDENAVLSVTASAWTGALETAVAQPFHEVRVLAEGHAEIAGVGAEPIALQPGEAVVLPAGSRYQWRQADDTAFYAVRFTSQAASGEAAGEPVHIRPRTVVDMRPSAAPAAALLLGETPQQEARPLFVDETGQWTVGVWRSTAYHRMTVPFPKYEFMYLLGGAVKFVDPQGHESTFVEGDTFFLAKSTVCDWKTDGMWKLYCIYDPK